MVVVWVPYYCSVAMCLSLPLLLLLLFVFARVSLCLLARVGVDGHRRGTALDHPCGMPPTGATIGVLLLKTWLAPDSTYTQQPSAVGLSVGMLAVRAVLYCCAVLCCAAAAVCVACVCFHRGHRNRCFITINTSSKSYLATKWSRILQTKKYVCTWSNECLSAYWQNP